MRSWGHGHSIGAGVLGGLLVSRRPELVFAAGVVVGAGLMYARRIVLAFEHGFAALRRAKLRTEVSRGTELRSRGLYRRRTRLEQERAERAAHLRGAADAGRRS